jgi:hypothetical protein
VEQLRKTKKLEELLDAPRGPKKKLLRRLLKMLVGPRMRKGENVGASKKRNLRRVDRRRKKQGAQLDGNRKLEKKLIALLLKPRKLNVQSDVEPGRRRKRP